MTTHHWEQFVGSIGMKSFSGVHFGLVIRSALRKRHFSFKNLDSDQIIRTHYLLPLLVKVPVVTGTPSLQNLPACVRSQWLVARCDSFAPPPSCFFLCPLPFPRPFVPAASRNGKSGKTKEHSICSIWKRGIPSTGVSDIPRFLKCATHLMTVFGPSSLKYGVNDLLRVASLLRIEMCEATIFKDPREPT